MELVPGVIPKYNDIIPLAYLYGLILVMRTVFARVPAVIPKYRDITTLINFENFAAVCGENVVTTTRSVADL